MPPEVGFEWPGDGDTWGCCQSGTFFALGGGILGALLGLRVLGKINERKGGERHSS